MEEIGAELSRLAGTDPLGPIDAHALVARGRRNRRRRMLLSAGGGVAGVAVVAIAASMLPNVGAVPDHAAPPVRGTAVTAVADFTGVPGLPRGEAALDVKLSFAQAMRLCTVRFPKYKSPLQRGYPYRPTLTVMRDLRRGDTADSSMCTIPGGDRPPAALQAAARRDPMPTKEADQLRNCSVQVWSDLTNWRVVASDTAPGRKTSLVALSPSGRHVAFCELVPTADPNVNGTPDGSGPGLWPAAVYHREPFGPGFAEYIIANPSTGSNSRATLYGGAGRTDSNVAKIRIHPNGSKSLHDFAVHDGWYTVSWLEPKPHTSAPYTLTAYDKNGHILKVIPGHP
ncbi:hypothetical protein AB0E69_13435 [Kribbella sp. NPDC026611]|uniref:hypothetical protein n=1 Tax=Kribbella sp. NPDC026611 TaxID=3154911 RepID=UPI0033FAAF6B